MELKIIFKSSVIAALIAGSLLLPTNSFATPENNYKAKLEEPSLKDNNNKAENKKIDKQDYDRTEVVSQFPSWTKSTDAMEAIRQATPRAQ